MGSSPTTGTSSEIPTTVPFPPRGENCTLVGISSLSARIRFTGFRAEKTGDTGVVRIIVRGKTRRVFPAHTHFPAGLGYPVSKADR